MQYQHNFWEQQYKTDPGESKILIIYGFTVAISVVMLILSGYVLRSVFKLVKFKDMPLLLSVVSVVLALLFKIIFVSLSIIQEESSDDSFLNTRQGDNVILVFTATSVFFIFAGFSLDLYKWGSFIMATGEKSMGASTD